MLPPASGAPDILGLSRNLGEVLGVFAVFHPQKDGPLINFIKTNSAHFEGLAALEDLIKKIGPPKWPWAVNPMLAAQGKLDREARPVRLAGRDRAVAGTRSDPGLLADRHRARLSRYLRLAVRARRRRAGL